MAAPRRRIWPALLRLLGPSLLLLAVLLGWVGWQALHARTDLLAAQTALRQAEQTATTSPHADLTPYLATVTRQAAAATTATSGPVWDLAEHIPILGRSLRAVAGIAASTDRLARQVLPHADAAYAALDTLKPGSLATGLPLGPLQALAPQLATASHQLAAEQATVAALPHSWLLPPVAHARTELLGRLTALRRTLQPAADTLTLLPGALGAHGPRTYLVAFLNPAEARGAGGLFAAYAVLTASSGRISLSDLGTHGTLPDLATPPPGVPTGYADRYGPYGGDTSWAASGLSPDFPDDAQTWAAMLRASTGIHVDGVLALDPVGLAALLQQTGPVTVNGIHVNAANVVHFVERGEYTLPISLHQRQQTLTALAQTTFHQLLTTRISGTQLVRSLGAAAAGRHIQFASLRPADEALLAGYPLAGVVPRTPRPFAMAVVNNAGAGKLDPYLTTSLRYTTDRCPGRPATATVTVTLTNQAPTSGLPAYVTTLVDLPTATPIPPAGTNFSWLTLLVTQGARVSAAGLDGQPLPTQPGPAGSDAPYLDVRSEQGHPALSVFLYTRPGQTHTLTVQLNEHQMTAAALAQSPLLLRQPLSRPTRVSSTVTRCP